MLVCHVGLPWWVLFCPVSFVPASFVGLEFLVYLVCVCVSMSSPPSLVVSRHPVAGSGHLTSGNNVRSHLIFTFERWPYNQM